MDYELPKKGEIKYSTEGKAICHICGKAYNKLLSHVVQVHDISSMEYKKRFGLDKTKGILSEKSKKIARDRLFKNYDKVVLDNLVNNEKSHNTRYKKGHKGRTIEKVSEQTLKRLKQTSFIKNNIS